MIITGSEVIRYATDPIVFTQMDNEGLLLNFKKYRKVLERQPDAPGYATGYEHCKKELERRRILLPQ